jgi:hypothetical protein
MVGVYFKDVWGIEIINNTRRHIKVKKWEHC